MRSISFDLRQRLRRIWVLLWGAAMLCLFVLLYHEFVDRLWQRIFQRPTGGYHSLQAIDFSSVAPLLLAIFAALFVALKWLPKARVPTAIIGTLVSTFLCIEMLSDRGTGWMAGAEHWWHDVQLIARLQMDPGTTILILLWLVLVMLAVALVGGNVLRYPPGHCGHCGYDLRGSSGPTCPECGEHENEARRRME